VNTPVSCWRCTTFPLEYAKPSALSSHKPAPLVAQCFIGLFSVLPISDKADRDSDGVLHPKKCMVCSEFLER
jgi:hypothetical protein